MFVPSQVQPPPYWWRLDPSSGPVCVRTAGSGEAPLPFLGARYQLARYRGLCVSQILTRLPPGPCDSVSYRLSAAALAFPPASCPVRTYMGTCHGFGVPRVAKFGPGALCRHTRQAVSSRTPPMVGLCPALSLLSYQPAGGCAPAPLPRSSLPWFVLRRTLPEPRTPVNRRSHYVDNYFLYPSPLPPAT